jgi:hypothetical protein
MKLRDAVKRIVETGGIVEIAHKSKINEWYGSVKVYKSTYSGKYFVEHGRGEFKTVDEAVDVFMDLAYTSKNIGYIQKRLDEKGINFEDDYDLEKPSTELRKMFKDEGVIVDEEYKSL